MTKQKQQEIIKWMHKRRQSKNVFDNTIQNFGTTKEVISFCERLSNKLNKALKAMSSYLEKK